MGEFRLPVLQGVLPVSRSQIPYDVIAGISLATLAIPEVMGYAKIAGMPVVTGLYTILVPVIVFAIFGSSRHLVIGADSATAAIIATSLAVMAIPGSPSYVALAGMIALLAAGFLIFSRIFALGFIADFLSRSVLIGFLTGVGIQVALSQIPGMFGLPGGSISNPVPQLINTFSTEIHAFHGATVFFSMSVLILILGGKKLSKKIPWSFIVVVGAIIVSWILNFPALGITGIGTVPSGLPAIALPGVPLTQIPDLLGVSVVCFIVILTQSAATSRAYAIRYDEEFNENADLLGLGLSNIAAGITGTFVVNGSPTKTEMVDNAGGRTQIAQIVMVATVIIVLLILAAPLSYLPSAALAAIVFIIGIYLIDVGGMKSLFYRRPAEFIVALLTAVTVVFVGVSWGIAVAIALSVIAHLRHSYHPLNFLLVELPSRGWILSPLKSGVQAVPGLAIYQFGANLYYANTQRFREEILQIAKSANPPLRWLCISASSIQDIDYTGSEALKQLYGDLKNQGVVLILSSIEEPVKRQLERDKIIDMVGREHIFEFTKDVVIAYRNTFP